MEGSTLDIEEVAAAGAVALFAYGLSASEVAADLCQIVRKA